MRTMTERKWIEHICEDLRQMLGYYQACMDARTPTNPTPACIDSEKAFIRTELYLKELEVILNKLPLRKNSLPWTDIDCDVYNLMSNLPEESHPQISIYTDKKVIVKVKWQPRIKELLTCLTGYVAIRNSKYLRYKKGIINVISQQPIDELTATEV